VGCGELVLPMRGPPLKASLNATECLPECH
jgi:hypothetical protein